MGLVHHAQHQRGVDGLGVPFVSDALIFRMFRVLVSELSKDTVDRVLKHDALLDAHVGIRPDHIFAETILPHVLECGMLLMLELRQNVGGRACFGHRDGFLAIREAGCGHIRDKRHKYLLLRIAPGVLYLIPFLATEVAIGVVP